MKILLSSANFCSDPLPVYPLGMSVIAKVLADAGHSIAQFDPMSHGRDAYKLAAEQRFMDFRPDLIAISIRNIDVADSNDVNAHVLKAFMDVVDCWRSLFDGPIVLGGPGFTMNPKAILANSAADYGVAGEGESAILSLVHDLETGKRPPKGTIYSEKAQKISGARYSQAIGNFYQEETHTIPIQTKRGCPFHCVYCTYPMLEGHALRMRPVDEVIADIRFIKSNFPDSMIYFTDSIFNDPGKRYKPILQAMIEQELQLPWTAFITPFKLDDDDIDLMDKSGLVCADLGVDGSTDATLAGLGKDFTFQQVRHCCSQFLQRKIGVNANAMFGAPGETWDTVRQGIENMLSLEPVYSIVFSGIRLLSGAPIIETARRENKIPKDWDDTKPLYYYAPGIEPERLHQMLLEGFKNSNYCIYPPASRNDDFKALHKFGYAKLRALKLQENTSKTAYRRKRK